MGYHPKYASGGHAAPAAPRRGRPSVLFILLGIVVVPAALALTGLMLRWMFWNLGRPKPQSVSAVRDQGSVAAVEDHVDRSLANARDLLLNIDRPQNQEDPVEETLPPVRKVYWIDDDAQVAPEPDQSLFGEVADPAQMQSVLDEAAWLLDGQELYFSVDTELFAGSTVRYYLDESIFAVTWKEVHEGSVYTFSEIKVSHPSQFRRHLAGGEYGSGVQYLATEMAATVNAVVASSADFYNFGGRNFGAVVYEGQARRVEGTYAETCYIDRNGDMHFTYGGEVLTLEDVQAYVDANDINFSLAFGPVLVDDYQVVEHTWYGVGEIDEGYARSALCQMGELHYIVVAANTEGAYGDIPTVDVFCKYIAATGCRMAYCLDGGQTATIVMNDQLINRPVYGQQRKMSDIIYFATAIPEGD